MNVKRLFWAVLSIVGALLMAASLVAYGVLRLGYPVLPDIVFYFMVIGGVFSLSGLVALGIEAFRNKD